MKDAFFVDELLEKAEALQKDGDYAACRKILLQVLAKKPADASLKRAVNLLVQIADDDCGKERVDSAAPARFEVFERLLRERTLRSKPPPGILFIAILSLLIWSVGLLLAFTMLPAIPSMSRPVLERYLLVVAVIAGGIACGVHLLKGSKWAYGATVAFYLVIFLDSLWGKPGSVLGVLLSGCVLLYLVGYGAVRKHFRFD